MKPLATGFLVGAPVWLAIGVCIGLRLVWAEEPEPAPDATPRRMYRWPEPFTVSSGSSSWRMPEDWTVTNESDDWATDPHLTTLTEGGKHP